MMEDTKRLGRLAYRVTLPGLLVLAAFNFGSLFYIYAVVNLPQKVAVTNSASILESAAKNDLTLKVLNKEVTLKDAEIKGWLERYGRSYSEKEDVRISSDGLSEYLKDLALSTNVEPVNANVVFEGEKATAFRPAVEGVRLNIEGSAQNIIRALKSGETDVELAVDKISPAITLERINDLGIQTLIAKGESNFVGSSSSRIHNIRVSASKYNGHIIKPGEEFSFNRVLGEVDETSGYLAELVIKSGQLIPEFGGGICQVSTTLFRAAINAGLPITERRPHSFPVKYYNPQGFDATIYPGVVDLKFKNDTSAHLLIQSKISGTKISFEIYGSDDGRIVAVEGPYQYDQKTNGAMKAYFDRKITKTDGTETEERFNSNYNAPILVKNTGSITPDVIYGRNPLE